MYTGVTKTKGNCPICKKNFPIGTLVWFDSSKSDGNNLVHKVCYDDLRASRGDATIGKRSKVKSSVDLDPPF